MRAKSGVLKLTHSPRLRVQICLDRFILSLSGGEKKTIFAVFWTSAFSDVDSCGYLRKLNNTGAQPQTFPYPTASISFLYSNVFMVKSGAQH